MDVFIHGHLLCDKMVRRQGGMYGGCTLREWRESVEATVEHGVVSRDLEKQEVIAKTALG